MQDFNFYKVNETLNHRYYQIPQELFVNPLYKNALHSDSKLLYGFLLDRLSLSIKNNWHDEDGNVYLIFTRKEVQDKLNLSDKTVTKAFKQLSDVNLIYEKKQGFSKPKLIYVAKIQHLNTNTHNRKNYDYITGISTITESENLRAINTNNNFTYKNNKGSKKSNGYVGAISKQKNALRIGEEELEAGVYTYKLSDEYSIEYDAEDMTAVMIYQNEKKKDFEARDKEER